MYLFAKVSAFAKSVKVSAARQDYHMDTGSTLDSAIWTIV